MIRRKTSIQTKIPILCIGAESGRSVCVYVCVCLYVCVSVCVCVCMCVCVCLKKLVAHVARMCAIIKKFYGQICQHELNDNMGSKFSII